MDKGGEWKATDSVFDDILRACEHVEQSTPERRDVIYMLDSRGKLAMLPVSEETVKAWPDVEGHLIRTEKFEGDE